MMTASLRATATLARRMPIRFASPRPQLFRIEVRASRQSGDRSSEACGIVDYCNVSQGDHNTNPRDCHQPPSDLIVPGPGKHLPIEHYYLVANGVPDGKQRLDDRNECRITGDLLTNAHWKQAFAAL